MRNRWIWVAVACIGVVAWMFTAMRDNLVYLTPVSQAVATRADQGTRTFRMGGSVVPGSIVETRAGVIFEVTEGGDVADVAHAGSPPQMFADCAPVVVEGQWDGDVFRSDRLLIKHGNEYEPPSGREAVAGPHRPPGVQ
jgi:cytochrome c-type biogenesis protein CcmE